ncbi:biofilm formation protein PslA [Sphingomonas metalli]|uniref:Biofilm formation protein PslA n=1 Tax=Sphingomonas metalli TaxID=1779358 RepID=A0A916WW41_9SPHN|nr:biofilm formation protein PslA [Sphingomonas metalli]
MDSGNGGNTAAPARDRRANRTPAMMELAGLASRLLEGGAVLIVGLIGVWITFDVFDLRPVEDYVRVAWLSAIAYALVGELTGCYDVDARFTLRVGWTRVLVAWVGACVVMLTMAFFMKASDSFSRGWAIFWFTSVATGLILARGVTTVAMRGLKRRGVFNQRVAILGSSAQGRRLANYISGNSLFTIDLVGCYDDYARGDEGGCNPWRGGLQALLSDIRAGRIDQVIIAMPYANDEELQGVVAQLSMLPVLIRLAPDLSSFTMAGQSMVMLGDLPLMTLFERPINGMDQVIKRVEDLVLGTLILIAAAPFLLIVAIAIKLDSPGPVFFRQEREGFNQQRFHIWKFRSMRVEKLEYDQIQQAKVGDPRVTRVGRIIRATSIDEIPQLFNVVIGDMSLVGPRPHAPSTRVAGVLFSEATQTYAARHRVKPGMTGWAQVNGWRGETDTDEKLLKRVEFDLFYIDHWSVGFDLYIMVRTVAAVMFPKSAY